MWRHECIDDKKLHINVIYMSIITIKFFLKVSLYISIPFRSGLPIGKKEAHLILFFLPMNGPDRS